MKQQLILILLSLLSLHLHAQSPSNITLNRSSVAENQPIGTTVGTFTTTGSGSPFTYTLVTGIGSTDNACFTVSTGSLKTAARFNFEVKNSYTIRVRTTDQAGRFFEKIFTIAIINVNETPTNIFLSNRVVRENQPAGTTIGNFSTADPDRLNTFTYTLVSGIGSSDNILFTISTGILKTAARFNFEVRSSYSIRVRTTDQNGLFFEKVFTIAINNVNETPANIFLGNSAVRENQPIGTSVGNFSTADPDVGNTFIYTLVSGIGSTDNALFTISTATLKTATRFNFEARSSYSIRVRSTDQNGLFVEKAFLIVVNNVNEAPTNIFLSSSIAPENQAIGTAVGNFLSADPDAANTFTYTLVSGIGSTDNASFSIIAGSLKTAAAFNFEVKSSYSIRVRSTDQNGLLFEKVFTIAINNVNEPPTNIVLSNSSVAENQPSGTTVGTLSTTDPDSGNTFTYTLVPGAGSVDNSSFAITANTLKTAGTFNYAQKNSYSIRLRGTDQGGLFFEKVIAIHVVEGANPRTPLVLHALGVQWDIDSLIHDVKTTAIHAVIQATKHSVETPALHGTVTQFINSGAYNYSYNPSPSDRLVYNQADGQTFNFFWESFNADASYFHQDYATPGSVLGGDHYLAFGIVNSSSEMALSVEAALFGINEGDSLNGQFKLNGILTTVDLIQMGTRDIRSEHYSASRELRGTISGDGFSMTVLRDAQYRQSNLTFLYQWYNQMFSSTIQTGNDIYAMNNVQINMAFADDKVNQWQSGWTSQGNVLRNDQPWGNFAWQEVVSPAHGIALRFFHPEGSADFNIYPF